MLERQSNHAHEGRVLVGFPLDQFPSHQGSVVVVDDVMEQPMVRTEGLDDHFAAPSFFRSTCPSCHLGEHLVCTFERAKVGKGQHAVG